MFNKFQEPWEMGEVFVDDYDAKTLSIYSSDDPSVESTIAEFWDGQYNAHDIAKRVIICINAFAQIREISPKLYENPELLIKYIEDTSKEIRREQYEELRKEFGKQK